MPSDDKKKKAQAKKDAAKRRNEKKSLPVPTQNGISTAKTIDDEAPQSCTFDTIIDQRNGERNDEYMGSGDEDENVHAVLVRELECLDLVSERVAQHRSVTGVLASHPEARDLHIFNLSITFHGHDILSDAKLELNTARRYGLIGLNGCGKSTLLAVIANRELPIPNHIDIFLLQREMPPSEKTALQCVMEVDEERVRLEREAELLAIRDDQGKLYHIDTSVTIPHCHKCLGHSEEVNFEGA